MKSKISLTVVVNGAPHTMEVHKNTLLKTIMQEALDKTYNAGRSDSDWNMLSKHGKALHSTQKLSEILPLEDNIIFISLKAGSGGNINRLAA
jgi:hypothetical protein